MTRVKLTMASFILLNGCDQPDSGPVPRSNRVDVSENVRSSFGDGGGLETEDLNLPPANQLPLGFGLEPDPSFVCEWNSTTETLSSGTGLRTASRHCAAGGIIKVGGTGCDVESAYAGSVRMVDMKYDGSDMICKYYKTTSAEVEVDVWCHQCI